MKKPNLFIVGAGKCGTTAMYHYLNQHPDIFMSNPKEPAYFCKDFHYESDEFHKKQKFFQFRSEQEYMKLFANAKHLRVIGEASTLYLPSKVAAKNIHEFNPNAKILIMIRNPVDLLYSTHSEHLLRFRENVDDFREALLLEKQRRKGEHIPKTVPAPSLLYYSEKANFSSMICRYVEIFEKDHLKIIVYEDFKNNNQRILREVLEFIDVDPNVTLDFKIYGPNRKIRSKIIRSLLESPYISQVPKRLITRKLYNKLRELFYEIAAKTEPRPPLQPQLRKELMRKFREEVEKTGNILNRDLVQLWGYENMHIKKQSEV